MNCDRCLKPLALGEHGLFVCPLETRAGVSVIGDDIPGGVVMEHGVCHADGSPRRYYSKSEIAREAKRLGLVSFVRHVPDRGSDKSANTTRWI